MSKLFDASIIYKYTCIVDQAFSIKERHHVKYFEEMQTIAELLKTAQYFINFLIIHTAKTRIF